ncbi:hypothetical protein LZ518_04550 [Sphingomonas sp. RB56-2]|uniref:Uncharacterized protein n=1 Tax=Sphingomonas brevis TaxID=2908206 RepID=A0ABT0S8E5_9SPHN|nr:hypothetical protein [Sphingomonas brevis]MCL6740399.1 hypothetical protein [Sphingomonas brevis]
MTFSSWYQLKLFVEHASGISMDALHVLAGVAILLLAARVLRQSLANILPWFATLILEIGNEIYDLSVEIWPDPGMQLGEGAKDIILTMALPTLLLLAARLSPNLLTGSGNQPLSDEQVADRPDVPIARSASPRLHDED